MVFPEVEILNICNIPQTLETYSSYDKRSLTEEAWNHVFPRDQILNWKQEDQVSVLAFLSKTIHPCIQRKRQGCIYFMEWPRLPLLKFGTLLAYNNCHVSKDITQKAQ